MAKALVWMCALGFAASALGCGSSEKDSATGETAATIPLEGPWTLGVAIPADEQAAGDADAGLYALANNAYVSCGVPMQLLGLVGGISPNASKLPLPGRDGEAATMPYAFNLVVNEDGAKLATQNCFTCHAEEFNGELVLGLGNTTANYTRDLTSFSNVPAAALLPPAEAKAFLKFQQRFAALAPHIRMSTVGSNPADLVAIVLASHRDPDTLAWIDEAQFDLTDLPHVPMDVPPWWRMGKKNAMFATGLGRGDHRRHMLASSTLCTDNLEEAAAIDAYANDINAFIRSLKAPAYPFAVDTKLAAHGENVFIRNCAGCHGLYGDAPSYPNLAFPVDVVGTDAAMASGTGGYREQLIDWYNDSFYGGVGTLVAFDGYVAPPLDGVWATAPFLHNGSVPTLEAVLNSKLRPTHWMRRNLDSRDFDEDALGWPYDAVTGADDPSLTDPQRPFVYDTTRLGHSNAGHTFGDALSDDDRRAVLEYLKTL